jgi:hypothetical protein
VNHPVSERCSAAARARHEPLIGTAPQARRWLLIEHQGPWSPNPMDSPVLAGATGQQVEAICEQHHARPLLIRRHGRSAPEALKQWFAVDIATRTWLRGTWRTNADLITAAQALGQPLIENGEDAGNLVLVCTHANRDACCALRGRPIAAALSRVWPEEVWECTHLGGHRFAGTLLLLPDGACYGGLDLPQAEQVIRAHRARTPVLSHLRGLTSQSRPVQAAVAHVLERFGPAALADAMPGVEQEVAEDVLRVEVIGSGSLPDSTIVEVRTEHLPPAPLSCGKDPSAHEAYHARVVHELLDG